MQHVAVAAICGSLDQLSVAYYIIKVAHPVDLSVHHAVRLGLADQAFVASLVC
jgi:hypothetical protein